MAVSNDNNFLFVLTETGSLSIVHIPGNFLVGTQPIPICDAQDKPIHIHVSANELIILTTNGSLLR